MADVGRLVEGVLLVRHRGKWRPKLCALEKRATFSSSLRLLVYDEAKNSCEFQDVVHAFISFLDPNHQGTLMLVCNYKVRCISFDQFSVMNKWTEVLEANLSYNYFHAELIVASRGSRLAKYAVRRPGYRLLSQRRSFQSAWNSNSRSRCGLSGRACGDGYLHVTRDRICFTTGLNCPRPRLLATWNFDNDEIVQCGTARLRPHCLQSKSDNGGEPADKLECNGSGPASLFFLTAFSDHPEAPGSYLFLSDRATELCEWIEHNNRSALDQAEWRRITSIAAVLECSDPPNLDQASNLCSARSTAVTMHQPFADCVVCANELDSVRFPMSKTGWESQEQNPVCHQLEHTREIGSFKEKIAVDQINPAPCVSNLSASALEPIDVDENLNTDVATKSALIEAEPGRSSSTFTVGDLKQRKELHLPDVRLLDFHARKLAAMYSRRRFSSHPVTATGDIGYVSGAHVCGVMCDVSHPQPRFNTSPQPPQSEAHHDCIRSDVRDRRNLPLRRGPQWRQSEPQLVTISPLPIPPSALESYLSHHSKYHLSNDYLRTNSVVPLNGCLNFSIMCSPCWSSACHEKLCAGSTVTSLRGHTHSSECSTTSASGSVVSSEPKCSSSLVDTCSSSCVLLDALSKVPAAVVTSISTSVVPQSNISHPGTTYSGFRWGAYRRRRLPSSWSTTTNAAFMTSGPMSDESGSVCAKTDKAGRSCVGTTGPSANCSVTYGGSLLPGRSFSSGSSPQYHFTPLHPACTVIPGSQYFTPHRRHTASACEAATFRSGFSSGDGNVNATGSVCSTFAHSSKASLISLGASAIPLWADAPSKAKPRTGCNYISREMLASISSQRKQQLQENHHPSSPPPPPPAQHPHPSPGINKSNSPVSYSVNTATHMHPHACTPVPEVSKETDDIVLKAPRCSECRCTQVLQSSQLAASSCLPSWSSETGAVPNPPELHSCTIPASELQLADPTNAPSQMTGRQYINMAPPSHINGLKPIQEYRLNRNDETVSCRLTHCPQTRSDSTSTALCSTVSGLDSNNGLNDAAALLDCTNCVNPRNLQSSYVNVTACVSTLSDRRTAPTSPVCTQSSHYINLASTQDAFRPCSADECGTSCSLVSCATPALPNCSCHRRHSTITPTNASTASLPSHNHENDSLGISRPAYFTPMCLQQNPPTAMESSVESIRQEKAPTTLPLSTLGCTMDNTRRLYYAHLMLSNDSCPVVRSSPFISKCAVSESNSEPTSDPQRPNFITSQSLSCSLSRTTEASTAFASQEATIPINSNACSGLNYVTIDSVQTKALSELERELRGAMELESSSYPLLLPGSRRATIIRTGINSSTLPGPSMTSDAFGRFRAAEHSSSHTGNTNGFSAGKSDGFSIWSRLVHSLSLHTPSHGRSEKNGGRRKVGRTIKSSKDVGSVAAAASSQLKQPHSCL